LKKGNTMTSNKRATKTYGLILAAIMLGILSPMAAAAGEPGTIYSLKADGLSCPFCAYGIEKQLGNIAGVESVATDIKSGTVTVSMAAGASLDESAARRAVEKAGFTLRSFKKGS